MPKQTVTERPIAIYTRVSEQGSRSDEELLSHDIQRSKVEAYLDALSLPASRETFKDNSRSGRKMSRPAFDRIMDGIRGGKYGGIAVYKLSRFGRNVAGVLSLVQELKGMGAEFVCVQPSIDTSNANGRFMLTVFAALDELVAELGVEEAGVLIEKKLAENTTLGGTAPVGYRFEVVGQDSNGKDRLGWIEPDPETCQIVRAALEGFASGRFAVAGHVADFLNDAGVLTSRGNKWNARNVIPFLRNEVHAGVRKYGDRRIEDAHEPLISGETHRAILRRLKPKTTGRTYQREDPTHELGGGLLRCPCGGPLSNGSANAKYEMLRCSQRGKGHVVISVKPALDWITRVAFQHGISLEEYAAGVVAVHSRSALVARVEEARVEVEELEKMLGCPAPAESVARRSLAAAEDALYIFDAEKTEAGGGGPVISHEAYMELGVSERIKVLRSLVERVDILPGKVGVHADKQDYGERIVVHFRDGSVHATAEQRVALGLPEHPGVMDAEEAEQRLADLVPAD